MVAINIFCVPLRLSFLQNIFYRHLMVVLNLFLITQGGLVQAQEEHSAKNAVYIELASRGPVYSINYDRIIRQRNSLAYSFSAGVSIEKNAFSFPLGIHFIKGIKDHHAEFGLTVIPYVQYTDQLAGSYKGSTDKYLYINPGIGYRYQKSNTGIFLKATIGPSIFLDPPSDDFWNMDPKLYGFGSLGVGISF